MIISSFEFQFLRSHSVIYAEWKITRKSFGREEEKKNETNETLYFSHFAEVSFRLICKWIEKDVEYTGGGWNEFTKVDEKMKKQRGHKRERNFNWLSSHSFYFLSWRGFFGVYFRWAVMSVKVRFKIKRWAISDDKHWGCEWEMRKNLNFILFEISGE